MAQIVEAFHNDLFFEVLVKEGDRPILLLSIKPTYSRLIRQGSKRIELRKRMPKQEPRIALVYETAPVSTIRMLIRIERIHEPPVKAIERRQEEACVDIEFIRKYYGSRSTGVAIEIRETIDLPTPISIKTMREAGVNPPQDYRYLLFDQVCELLHSSTEVGEAYGS